MGMQKTTKNSLSRAEFELGNGISSKLYPIWVHEIFSWWLNACLWGRAVFLFYFSTIFREPRHNAWQLLVEYCTYSGPPHREYLSWLQLHAHKPLQLTKEYYPFATLSFFQYLTNFALLRNTNRYCFFWRLNRHISENLPFRLQLRWSDEQRRDPNEAHLIRQRFLGTYVALCMTVRRGCGRIDGHMRINTDVNVKRWFKYICV